MDIGYSARETKPDWHLIRHNILQYAINFFLQKRLVKNPQLATAKWSNQKYGNQTEVWPGYDLDQIQTYERRSAKQATFITPFLRHQWQLTTVGKDGKDTAAHWSTGIDVWRDAPQTAVPRHGRVSQRGRRRHQELSCYTGGCMMIHCSNQWQTQWILDTLQEKQAHTGPESAVK